MREKYWGGHYREREKGCSTNKVEEVYHGHRVSRGTLPSSAMCGSHFNSPRKRRPPSSCYRLRNEMQRWIPQNIWGEEKECGEITNASFVSTYKNFIFWLYLRIDYIEFLFMRESDCLCKIYWNVAEYLIFIEIWNRFFLSRNIEILNI